MRVDRIHVTDKEGLRVPVIVCHPKSGVGEVAVEFSIKWDEPLCMDPVWEDIELGDHTISLPVVQRVERVAEKVRAFLDRAEDRDAYDLYHYTDSDPKKGLIPSEWALLRDLIQRKVDADDEMDDGWHRPLFNENVAKVAGVWATRGGLVVMDGAPEWSVVEPWARKFRRYLPATKARPDA